MIIFAMIAAASAPCSTPSSQRDLITCLDNQLEIADAELAKQWAVTRAKVRADAQEVTEEDPNQPDYEVALIQSQYAWKQYRDAECDNQSLWAHKGTDGPAIYARCAEKLTRERIAQLKDRIEGLSQ